MRQGNSSTSWIACIALAALMVVAMLSPINAAAPRGDDEQQLNSKAEQSFNKARELFDEENWPAAAAKFEEFLATYPQDRNAAAAHYWLAMTLKKQAKYAEADERLSRLLNEFPYSNWTNDARALRVEIAGLTRNEAMIVQSTSDQNENVKLTALQSLLRIDPDRALKMIADVLRPDSKESVHMKLSAVTMLRRVGGKAAVPLLSQVINEQTATELRVRAIYTIAQIDDPGVFEVLKAASSSDNKHVAEASLFAIAQLPGEQPAAFISEKARGSNQQSILLLGQQETNSAVDELISIYDTNQDIATRKQTMMALGLNQNPRAKAKLWEIARQQDGNAALRTHAILALGQGSDSRTLNEMAQFYDQEKDEGLKKVIIMALAQSNEKVATRKLMAIASSDPSQSLRGTAKLSLQRFNDPEVRKFLQEN